MNIIGCMLFVVAGILAIKVTRLMAAKEAKDYSVCDTATGVVGHTEDFGGDRWIVTFTDKTGREVYGMDDEFAYSAFSDKYKRPTFGAEEQVYYYPYTGNSRYHLNGERIQYYVHFCNENLYELANHKKRTTGKAGTVLGIFFFVCGILIFLRG